MKFPIAKILNFADGRLLTTMDDVYEFANYMTGDNLFTHQLVRAFREIGPVLRQQLPFLASPEFKADQDWLTDALTRGGAAATIIAAWLVSMEAKYGPEHDVQPLADWMQQNPISELVQMRESKAGIIVVDADGVRAIN